LSGCGCVHGWSEEPRLARGGEGVAVERKVVPRRRNAERRSRPVGIDPSLFGDGWVKKIKEQG
jgi:hypothetical protein